MLPSTAAAGFSTAQWIPKLGAAVKAPLLMAHVLAGILLALPIAAADALGLGARIPRERIAQAWNRVLLRILNVRLHVRGKPLRVAHLAVANHVSWLDIPVICACTPVRFVSRHDVKDWPVAGMLADACGTFYIRRGSGRSRDTLAAMTPHLASRGSIALFPEGTTSDGQAVLPFHPRLFEAALTAGAPVQPIALRYSLADGRAVAPFVGNMTLVGHILAVLACTELHVEVQFFAAHVADGDTTRDAWAAQARRSIESAVRRGPFVPPAQVRRARGTRGARYQ